MIQNWFRPVESAKRLSGGTFLKHLHFFPSNSHPEGLRECQLAIVGVDAESADLVRSVLYSYQWHFGNLKVYDLGNVLRSDVEFTIPALRELTASGILPLIVGTHPRFVQAQYQSFLELRNLISLAVIDSVFACSSPDEQAADAYLDQAVYRNGDTLFHLAHIGGQGHLLRASDLQLIEERNFESIRLGRARSDLPAVEPVIRDADLVSMHLRAIRASDAPDQSSNNPSGFFLEEACQIARYAGLSDKLQSFALCGFQPGVQLRDQQQTAAAMAQLLWYFIDGFHQRKQDFPISNEGLTEYIVDFSRTERLTFWKSSRSGRWWVQTPVETPQGYTRHRLIACSHSDYLQACKGELPERLINAFKRFG